MRKKVAFVCFTGIDGSGKSTLAKSLVKKIKEKSGIEFRYVWGNFEPFLMKPIKKIIRLTFLSGKDMFKNYKDYTVTKKKVSRSHPILSLFYNYYVLFDYLLQVFFKIVVALWLGKRIISDRYIYDVAIYLSLNLDFSDKKFIDTIKIFFRFFPKPDITFLIDMPEHVAYRRKNDIPAIEYLQERRQIYLNLAKENGMIILDGTKSVSELTQIVRNQIGNARTK